MLTLEVRCLCDEQGKLIPLLTEAEKSRLIIQRDELGHRSDRFRLMEMDGEALLLEFEAKAIQDRLDLDTKAAEHPDARTIKVEYREPTIGDFQAVQGCVGGPGSFEKLAFELLSPKIVEGLEGKGEIPMRLYPVVSGACYRAIDFSLDEDKRFFLRRRPSVSPA